MRRAISFRSAFLIGTFTFGTMAALAGGSTSCASAPDNKRYTEILQPDLATYVTHVDEYLVKRCGTLDCHGQPGRAYRLYGFTGLRPFDAGSEGGPLVSGQQATIEGERLENYWSAVALEPEEMTRLMATQGSEPEKLMLLRKPLRSERHKGGPAMDRDDPGYRCVVAWLRIRTVRRTADGLDFETIPPGERDQLSARAINDCATAALVP